MNQLHVEKILDYCDLPLLFVARDNFDTLYLSLFFDDEPEPVYTAIRISQHRLSEFLDGRLDLRDVMEKPENKEEYFNVTVEDSQYVMHPLLVRELPEERLPDRGYMQTPTENEYFSVSVPRRDHSLFKDLVRKFGWVAM